MTLILMQDFLRFLDLHWHDLRKLAFLKEEIKQSTVVWYVAKQVIYQTRHAWKKEKRESSIDLEIDGKVKQQLKKFFLWGAAFVLSAKLC